MNWKTIILILVLAGVGWFALSQNKGSVAHDSGIQGCYVANFGQDVYKLNVETQNEADVYGTLSFQNYQKDSSSGTFTGKYENGVLLGDYSFRSEGMNSVMQVVFKKIDGGFQRGFGPVDEETGTKFTDLSAVSYDSAYTFVKAEGMCE